MERKKGIERNGKKEIVRKEWKEKERDGKRKKENDEKKERNGNKEGRNGKEEEKKASYTVLAEKSPCQKLASHHSENPTRLPEKLNLSIHAYQLPPVWFERAHSVAWKDPNCYRPVGSTRAVEFPEKRLGKEGFLERLQYNQESFTKGSATKLDNKRFKGKPISPEEFKRGR
ncbi:hypothetical protein L345_01525, partial [Ophiophagus hannah]